MTKIQVHNGWFKLFNEIILYLLEFCIFVVVVVVLNVYIVVVDLNIDVVV